MYWILRSDETFLQDSASHPSRVLFVYLQYQSSQSVGVHERPPLSRKAALSGGSRAPYSASS
jgi:hypothetical protein